MYTHDTSFNNFLTNLESVIVSLETDLPILLRKVKGGELV